MPAPEHSHRTQTALLWAVIGVDAHNEPVVGLPDEIQVRWENARVQMASADGTVVTVDATAVVGRDVNEGSLMRLGDLEDWNGTGSNDDDNGLMQVVAFSKVPDVKGRNFRRVVGMIRFRDEVP